MPVKLRRPKRAEYPITVEAVAAYRAGDWLGLHRALGLKPWQPSPLDAVGECPWNGNSAGATFWPLAVELRAELESASCP